jgi:hypothetical protein
MPTDDNKILTLLRGLIKELWKKKQVYIYAAIIGIIIGVSYAKFAKVKYKSQLVFLINESKSSAVSPLGVLAGQFGLGQVGPAISEDRLGFIYSSKEILGGALLHRFENGICIGDSLIKIKKWKSSFEGDTFLIHFDSFKGDDPDKLSVVENKVLNMLIDDVLLSKQLTFEALKKKSTGFVSAPNSGIVIIGFENSNESICKEFPRAIYDELSTFYSDAVTGSLQSNFDLISQRADSLGEVLLNLERETANAMDEGYNVFKFKGKLEESRLKRNLQIIEVLYGEVIKNKELAKFNLDQEKPVFQIIDEPIYPLEIKERSMLLFGLIGGAFSFFLCLILIVLWFIKNNLKEVNFYFSQLNGNINTKEN